jgi:hypothetical protein
MALQLYTDQFWYPTGALAASVPFQIFPIDSNAFAALWQDSAGTIPLPNPGSSTDGTGTVTFWAEVGQYWVHLDTETFLIDVGLSEEQADLSTGIASGGDMIPDVLNPAAVEIKPLIGYIVDNTDPLSVEPTVTRVDYPGGIVPLDAGSLLRTITYWRMDASQNLIQQALRPTPEEYRQSLVLGLSLYETTLGFIFGTQSLPTILPQQANQLVDLMDALGPFAVNGNKMTPNAGANLSVDKSGGLLFARAFTYTVGGIYTDNPHITMSPNLVPAAVRYITQNPVTVTPPPSFTIDPANYDVGGVVTPIPGASTTATVQRIYLFAADDPQGLVVFQYGQNTYATLADAVRSVGAGEQFLPSPVTEQGALIGYLAVTKAATDLTDRTQAVFMYAGKFATP